MFKISKEKKNTQKVVKLILLYESQMDCMDGEIVMIEDNLKRIFLLIDTRADGKVL